MAFDRWQAPDRDSPETLTFSASVELGRQLDALFQAEGHPGTREEVVLETSGVEISRPRRWHKMFERMGLLYQDSNSNTQLTGLGAAVREAKATAGRDFRRGMAEKAISVLRKFQLKNPADPDEYPEDADIHPYWAIWKAAIELDGKIHWDELNRELMWVLRHSELDDAIARIRQARSESDYDPVSGGASVTKLRSRAYDQDATTDDRDPSGQVRDQKTTPWFKRAGLGELLLNAPGRAGNGYWSIHPDVRDLLEREVRNAPPAYRRTADVQDWFSYYGALDSRSTTAVPAAQTNQEIAPFWALLQERQNVVFFGPPGTGKTHAGLSIAARWEHANGAGSVFRVTFHPSYGYEEFVQGYRPDTGSSHFQIRPGVLLEGAKHARTIEAAGKSVLIFIDEINRGDVARIFGELITYIEPSKRDVPCTLAHTPLETFSVPKNLFFLGTMNTADKSVSLLDVAMRRRFAFVDFPADSSAFERNGGWASSVVGIPLRIVLERLNKLLAREGIDSDRSIGQALLKVDANSAQPLQQLRQRFLYDIVPLVGEYCYLDRERMRRVLGGLVDEEGRCAFSSDAEFESRLRAWIGQIETRVQAVEMPPALRT